MFCKIPGCDCRDIPKRDYYLICDFGSECNRSKCFHPDKYGYERRIHLKIHRGPLYEKLKKNGIARNFMHQPLKDCDSLPITETNTTILKVDDKKENSDIKPIVTTSTDLSARTSAIEELSPSTLSVASPQPSQSTISILPPPLPTHPPPPLPIFFPSPIPIFQEQKTTTKSEENDNKSETDESESESD